MIGAAYVLTLSPSAVGATNSAARDKSSLAFLCRSAMIKRTSVDNAFAVSSGFVTGSRARRAFPQVLVTARIADGHERPVAWHCRRTRVVSSVARSSARSKCSAARIVSPCSMNALPIASSWANSLQPSRALRHSRGAAVSGDRFVIREDASRFRRRLCGVTQTTFVIAGLNVVMGQLLDAQGSRSQFLSKPSATCRCNRRRRIGFSSS